MEQLLTIKELAEMLQVPIATVYAWRSTGDGPRGSRVGRHVRYARADVVAWLDAHADRPAPAA